MKKPTIHSWEVVMTTTKGEKIVLDTYELSYTASDLIDELIDEQGYKTTWLTTAKHDAM